MRLALLFIFAIALLPPTRPAQADDDARKPAVLITGANRGIGFEWVRQFSARDWHIIATTRSPERADALRVLAGDDPDIVIEQLDVTDHARVDALAGQYRDTPIDILLLNAAMGPSPDTAMLQLEKLDWERGRQSLEVNAIGPMKISQAFMPHVRASDRKLIIAMSSDSGSFEAGSQAPILYHYKMSKAALNMYLHTLAFETKRRGVTVVMLHPGLVGTNEQLAKFPGAITPEASVTGMFGVIDGLTADDNGKFIDWQGNPMPW